MNQKMKNKKVEKVKCWKFFKCDKKECPAYKSRNLRCWLFSGTLCRDEIQGKFINKIEMCLGCKVFKTNMDIPSMRKSCQMIDKQIKEYTHMLQERDRELESMSIELALGLSEAFEGLKKISIGDPTVRISETSEIELIRKLKHIINLTAENIGEIVDQSHEFAMGLAEHFDVLHRVSKGDLSARVSGKSTVELLESLKNVTNETIKSIDKEIANRKKAEDDLIHTLSLLSVTLESTVDGILVVDREGKIVSFNNKFVNMWRIPDSIITSREDEKALSFVLEQLKEPEQFSSKVRELYAEPEAESYDLLEFKDGRVFQRHSKPQKIAGITVGRVWSFRDVTEQRKMENEIRESEKKYLDLYQNAPDGYHSIGPDGTILEVNDTWLRMLGYDRDEVIGKMKLTDLLTDDGIKIFQRTFAEFKQKGSTENIDYTFKRKDGFHIPILLNATAIYDENGKFLRSRAIVRDNSEKKAFEEKLVRASEEWKATFDSMPYGVMLLDIHLNILRANEYISELFHIPYQSIAEKRCYDLNYGSSKPAEFCISLQSKLISGSESIEYYDANLNKYFMMHGTPILNEEGSAKAFVLSLIDITEIKDKETRLIESKDAFFNILKELDISYKELKGLYESLIYSFVNAIDAKSPWTKGHSERVAHYAVSIAKELELKEQEIETLRIASLLHDIGKISTYDVILEKPIKLTDEEFALIRMHPVRGEEILKPIKQFSDLLPIVRHHHERLDGRGYPDGLSNGQIPFLSKIIAIADSFDSMTSDRPYRPAKPREHAISELKRCSGTQFEPQVVEAFLKFLEKTKQ